MVVSAMSGCQHRVRQPKVDSYKYNIKFFATSLLITLRQQSSYRHHDKHNMFESAECYC